MISSASFLCVEIINKTFYTGLVKFIKIMKCDDDSRIDKGSVWTLQTTSLNFTDQFLTFIRTVLKIILIFTKFLFLFHLNYLFSLFTHNTQVSNRSKSKSSLSPYLYCTNKRKSAAATLQQFSQLCTIEAESLLGRDNII